MTIPELLYLAVEEGILRHLDMQFAIMVAGSNEPAVMLAAALLSKDTGEGHVCLPIARLVANKTMPKLFQLCFSILGRVDWTQTLLCSTAVSRGDTPTPLIFSDERLYLNRMWRNELTIVRFFNGLNQSLLYDKILLIRTLNDLFGTEELINWQKVAAAVALTRRISVISGGPGTGKTTTVAKLLMAIIQMAGKERCRIKLAAPTGKAAARLTELIGVILQRLSLTEAQRKCIPNEAYTLHRLLGAQLGNQHFRHHAGNPLHLDVLVVDEASMVDLTMMSCLINALPLHARVIFLGDSDQLASVEAGAVLGDICTYAKEGYTEVRARELSQLTGYPIEGNSNLIAGALRDRLCLLQKSYRFGPDSGIGQLASAVKRGDCHAIKTIFKVGFSDIKKTILQTGKDYLQMIEEVLEGYFPFLNCVHQKSDPKKICEIFNQFQMLCALRKGPFGVTGLNERFEQILWKTKNINRQSHSPWYEGRPVMILRNDSILGLSNGDIGIALDRGEGLRIWFRMLDGSVKSVQPNSLPEHETVWAMTVHKSQGSEFDHVALILPIQIIPVITRELVYTAITRASKRLSLYIDDHVLMQAVLTCTERRSGLNSAFKST